VALLHCPQANSNFHVDCLAESNVLRRERDELALELIKVQAQLAQCNTARGFRYQPTIQPADQPTRGVGDQPVTESSAGHIIQSLATQNVPGKSSSPSRGAPSRSLQQAESVELNCSKADVKAVSAVATDAKKVKALVANMTVTNTACAECVQTCAPDYRIGCLFRCQHQRENQCTETTKIASLISKATLQDRRLLVLMIEQVSASCAYCILETVESVCGVGCVQETMHITTDYPILPRPCLPELADVLKSHPPVPQLPNACSVSSRVIAIAEVDVAGVMRLNVPASASPLDVACILAERFRRVEGDASVTATTLVVPVGISPIMMLADLIVNPGETVRIEAGLGVRVSLVVGERQLQVYHTPLTAKKGWR
jgi:hypothetical protein